MATSQQTGRAPGLQGAVFAGDWAIHDNPTLIFPQEGDFDADITAVAEEQAADDSGYISSDGNESKISAISSHCYNSKCAEEFEMFSNDVEYIYAAASTEVNYGSVNDLTQRGGLNDAKSSKHSKAGRGSSTHSQLQEYGGSIRPNYANLSDEVSGPSPLESWALTYERHESIAYRLEQTSAKKRRIATARQQ
jgi:hypothetical protein